MHHFHQRNGELYCEDVRVAEIADQVGTPCYVYSTATLTQHFNAFDSAFSGIAHRTCFAVKSCSNIAILRLFASLGGGADIVSGGELFRAGLAGIPGDRIVYSGVGKTRQEIREALAAGILMFNVESDQELRAISEEAGRLGKTAPVALRVNPDVDPRTHAYISTGLAKNKFGIPMEEALAVYQEASRLANIQVVGVSCHIGSQLTEISPFIETLHRLTRFMEKLRGVGIDISYLDLGGGLGIRYQEESPPHPREYGEAVKQEMGERSCTLILEPGRVIVGNAGILVTRVLYTKRGATKDFIIVDAGMNDLARPSLYGAYHAIQLVNRENAGEIQGDVVGPICETGDFLARDQKLPAASPGDLLAVMSAGAYGFSMASNYNSRPRAAEVLVNGGTYHLIRQRESYQDLVRGESIPPFLSE